MHNGQFGERTAEQLGHTDFFAKLNGERLLREDVAIDELQAAVFRDNAVFACEIAGVKRQDAASFGTDDRRSVSFFGE